MSDIFQEYKNPRGDLSSSSSSNNNHGDVSFTPKNQTTSLATNSGIIKRPSPQRQRPQQSPPRSYLSSPNQKFNPQYHFVAVRSRSVDSRSTASYTTGATGNTPGTGTGTGNTCTGTSAVTTGTGAASNTGVMVTNAASRTSLFSSVGSMDEEDEEDEEDVGEIPPITTAASNGDDTASIGIYSCATPSTHNSCPSSHASSRCSSRRSFQEYMMGKMQKSLELERQLIFEHQQQNKANISSPINQHHSNSSSLQPPSASPRQYQSPKNNSHCSSSNSQNNMMIPGPGSTTFFDSGHHSCSSSPPEPPLYYSALQQQASPNSARTSAASTPCDSHSAAASHSWTQNQHQQQQSSMAASPARSTRSAYSTSQRSINTAATASTSTRLLATTTALVATAEEQLLRVNHTVPGTTASLAVPQPSLSGAFNSKEDVAWKNEVMDKKSDIHAAATNDHDNEDGEPHHQQQQPTSTRKSVFATNTTFASTLHDHNHNNTTVSSNAYGADVDVTALPRASWDNEDDSILLRDTQESSTPLASWNADCPDTQHRLLEESWDDAVQNTSRLHEQQNQQHQQHQQHQQQTASNKATAHAGSRLNQQNFPVASTSAASSFGVTAAASAAAAGGGNRRRSATLHHFLAGRGQRQQQPIQQHSFSPQRRIGAPGALLAGPPLSSPQASETRHLEQQGSIEEPPRQQHEHQRGPLPVQRKVAIMRDQLQQQLAAKSCYQNQQNPVGGSSPTLTNSRLHPSSSSSVRNFMSSPPREQQQLAMVPQRGEQQQQLSHQPTIDPVLVVSPQHQRAARPLEQPRTLVAAVAASQLSLSPPHLPPRQHQQHPQQQISPTSRALAARQVGNSVKRVRQLQLQQRQGRLHRPGGGGHTGLPQVPSGSNSRRSSSNNYNSSTDLSGRKQIQLQKPPPPPLPSLMSSVMSSITLTAASEPSANVDGSSSMYSLASSSSSSRIFQDEKKHEDNHTSYDNQQHSQSDESDNYNDSSKDDSFWDPSKKPHLEQQHKSSLDASNNANDSHIAVLPSKKGRRGGQNTNDKNNNEMKQTSTMANVESASANRIAPSMEGGGGRLDARITANKMAGAAAKGSGHDDDGSNFSWGSLAPSHQITTASAAGTSNGGVVLSPTVASQIPEKDNPKSMHEHGNANDVAPFDSEITIIPQEEEDDSLAGEPRTVFSDPFGFETTNNGKPNTRRATWRRQGQQQEHEWSPRGTYPLMQTSSLISASEMSRRRTITQDVLVTVGGVLDNGDLHNPLQEYQESFYHSSHILAYASPTLSQHLRPTVGQNNYRLDLPRATSSEWKLLQQFLEPHSKSAAGVSSENLPTLLPWFHELQLDILLKQCDEILCTLDIVMDRFIGDGDDEQFSVPLAKDWGDLLTLAEICTLGSLHECHKKALKAVQVCLERHPGLCLDLPVLNKLSRLLQVDIATRSTLWETLSPYLPEEVVLETRSSSQVQQLVCNTLFPYLLREGLREAVTLLDEERNRQVETERLLEWRQRKKELESMGDDHGLEISAQTPNSDISNGKSILQSNSLSLELEYGRPVTPPSRDEIILSRSLDDDYIHRTRNICNTPNATNNSTFLSYSNSAIGSNKLDLTNIENSFNSNDTSASNFSQSSRLMRKLERAKFGVKQQHIDSISGDIQRKINSDPFRGYVELHYNIAEWWESWKEGPHEQQGKDEQRQDEGRNEQQQRAQFEQQQDKPNDVLRRGRSDTVRQSTNSSDGSCAKNKGKPGKSSPTTITAALLSPPMNKGRLQLENRTAWLDLILHRLRRPPIFPSTTVIAQHQGTQQQQQQQHPPLNQHWPIPHRHPSMVAMVTPPGCAPRRTFAC